MEERKVNGNRQVAGLFAGCLVWPVFVYLVISLLTARNGPLDPLGGIAIIAFAALGELVLLFCTFVMTFVHWRSLRWPWRLIGLLAVAAFVLLIGCWIHDSGRPIWQD